MSATGIRWTPNLLTTNATPQEAPSTQLDQAALSITKELENAPTQKASSARTKPRNGFTVGHTQVAAKAEAVVFLASDGAGFITGHILDVNGGYLMG